MDEENITRALMIGATTLMGIMTITAIIIFFRSSLKVVESTGNGMDFDTVYRNDIESSLLMNGTNNYIKGTSVKNILSYYEQNANVTMNISNIKYIDKNGNIQIYNNVVIDSSDYSTRENTYNIAMNYIMDNQDFEISVNTLDNNTGSKNIVIRGV